MTGLINRCRKVFSSLSMELIRAFFVFTGLGWPCWRSKPHQRPGQHSAATRFVGIDPKSTVKMRISTIEGLNKRGWSLTIMSWLEFCCWMRYGLSAWMARDTFILMLGTLSCERVCSMGINCLRTMSALTREARATMPNRGVCLCR